MRLPSCPTDALPVELADWIELAAVVDEWPVISRSRVKSAVESSTSSTDAEDIDTALRDLHRRTRWGDRLYPFVKDGSNLRRKAGIEPWPYLMLVLLANRGLLANSVRGTAGDLFEEICHLWLRAFLGSRGQTIRFDLSAPDRPSNFAHAVSWLADQLGLRPGQGYTPTSRNDGGVDLVGWLPFADTSDTALVVLCQATVQVDFLSKATDIDPRLWGKWIAFLVEPARLLMVPHVVSRRSSQWTEVSDRGVALVDRRRFCEVLKWQDFDGRLSVMPRNWVVDSVVG